MRISRIKRIQNVGSYSSFNGGGKIPLNKLNFIYGFNTYGKTTLTDIFRSLKQNDPSIIGKRESIPSVEEGQEVHLTVFESGCSEKSIIFQNGSWSENSISSNIEIFDSEFIFRNLFSGVFFDRKTKENFTQFIIGERGVEFANKIASNRKKLGELKKELKASIPKFSSNFSQENFKEELEDFLVSKPEHDSYELINNELSEKIVCLDAENKRFEEPEKIIGIKNPELLLSKEYSIINKLTKVNVLLSDSYSSINDEVLKNFERHVNSNFSNKDGAETWVREGLSYCKDHEGGCPFCGASLGNAKNIISIYQAIFDEAYKRFVEKVENDGDELISSIEKTNFNEKYKFTQFFLDCGAYKNLIDKPSFKKNLEEIQEISEELCEEELNGGLSVISSMVKAVLADKNKLPHRMIQPIDFYEFKCLVIRYYKKIVLMKRLAERISSDVDELKSRYKDAGLIKKNIEGLNSDINSLNYRKARIDQDDECILYSSIREKISKLEKEIIPSLEANLEEDQSMYLEKYFKEINELFKLFGSKDFTLEQGNTKSGHFPIYFLKVKFRGESIKDSNLDSVFSESDRRALAFSIFLAKINLNKKEEKNRLIIIMDDPIVSFDDNRIRNTVFLLKQLANSVSQVFIMTHYMSFIKNFYLVVKDKELRNQQEYVVIEKNEETSYLKKADKDFFIFADFEKIFNKIYRYINREHNNCIKSDLRPFLEDLYLPVIFAKKIKDKSIDRNQLSLKELIDELFEDEHVRSKMHNFREILNVDHHNYLGSAEDVRNFANQMMDYLFSLSYPDSMESMGIELTESS